MMVTFAVYVSARSAACALGRLRVAGFRALIDPLRNSSKKLEIHQQFGLGKFGSSRNPVFHHFSFSAIRAHMPE
jgi:hypothetical protein